MIKKITKCFYLLLFIFLITSCKKMITENHANGKVRKEYYKDKEDFTGGYKEYFTNGELKLIHNFDDRGNNIDTSFYYYKIPIERIQFKRCWLKKDSIKQIEFYKNGSLKKESIVNSDFFKIGKWKFYDENENLDFSREYLLVNGKHYLNQTWNIDKNKDTVFKGSNFIEIQVAKDTILLGSPLQAVAYLKAELFKGKSSEILVCLPHGERNNFNTDFSNLSKIKLDTFYNLQHDLLNKNKFDDNFSKPYTVVFGKWFKKSTGLKKIRGFVEEYYQVEGGHFKQNRTFFEIQIYVKDTISPAPASL